MKVQLSENNDYKIPQQIDPNYTINYKDRNYTYVGDTKGKKSGITRIKALVECVGFSAVRLFSKKFKNNLKTAWNELTSGQETIKHFVIHTDVFNPTKESKSKLPTPQESFQKGQEDAKNAPPGTFD